MLTRRNIFSQFCLGQLLAMLLMVPGYEVAAADEPKHEPTAIKLLSDLPETRAVGFLSREVPQWSPTNKCFSCHNNGDAVRALYAAKRLGYPIIADSLADTTDWLSHPDRWNSNGGDGPFNNKRLARIQFTAALQSAAESGSIPDRQPLRRAATLLADEQDADGSWLSDAVGALGSPATYGRPLATWIARDTLRAADHKRFARNIEKADQWLQQLEINNIMDAATVLLASADSDDLA